MDIKLSHLEEGAVALQTGRAEWGNRAQAAPKVDPRQQRTVSQQQTRRGLQKEGGREEDSEGGMCK